MDVDWKLGGKEEIDAGLGWNPRGKDRQSHRILHGGACGN
jgi:hypothetical protein